MLVNRWAAFGRDEAPVVCGADDDAQVRHVILGLFSLCIWPLLAVGLFSLYIWALLTLLHTSAGSLAALTSIFCCSSSPRTIKGERRSSPLGKPEY